MYSTLRLLWQTGLILVVTASPGVAADTQEPPAQPPYQIQSGDVLQVSVWKEPDLQAELIVRPDGGVSFPLAGDLPAAGGTVEDLRRALDERLRKFIPDPVVTVAVKAIAGNRIYVAGKVNRPGDFLLSRPLDVMQALALAGGATPYADVDDIRILRRDGARLIALRFRYSDVAQGKALEQNILLQSGDTVVVP
ncbi:MAG TPA: polysaccharide biosynthesis/export family protein [Steroidobacteraceae bacterium]|nr:polysaccharide biosynthesis/export family protein [Steroidobacteraceae bacterium]